MAMNPEVVDVSPTAAATTAEVPGSPPAPDTGLLITEDDAPVDNIYVEKLQRLLTEPLYSSWTLGGNRTFLALANVGLFYSSKQPALVPDVMLSLDVPPVEDRRASDNRSYFSWVVGKLPEVVIEIVSDRRGREDTGKRSTYARLRIPYYVVFDPGLRLGGGLLRTFAINESHYTEVASDLFSDVGLGLKLWRGVYEEDDALWLRWCDPAGELIPTGKERADRETQRADAAERRNRELIERLRRLGEMVE
jgi:Uma2 family endonuclease